MSRQGQEWMEPLTFIFIGGLGRKGIPWEHLHETFAAELPN